MPTEDDELMQVINIADKWGCRVCSPWDRKTNICVRCKKSFTVPRKGSGKRRMYCSLACSKAMVYRRSERGKSVANPRS